MLRYENICNVGIKVNVLNDYDITALAQYDKENDEYIVSFWLQQKTVDFLDLMEDDIKIYSTQQDIRRNIVKYITEQFVDDKIKHYIDRYDYQMKCFAKGHELLKEGE